MQETSSLAHTDLLYRSQEEIRVLQNQRFRHQIGLCFRAHPYYQEIFRRLKLTPDDFQTIEDVQKLPVTTKQDYLSNPEAFRLTALPEFSQIERTLWDVNYTTGTTTGIPAPLFNTTYDIFASAEPIPRFASLVGLMSQDIVINLYPLTPYPHLTSRFPLFVMAMGASVASPLMSVLDPDQSLDEVVWKIEQHKGTVLGGIPSFVHRVLMRADELGANFSQVRLVMVAGESFPRGTREDMRRRLVHLGANIHDLRIICGLGFTEMQGSATECVEYGGCHNPAPDQIYFEVLDEQSHSPLPNGQLGLFTITHLDRRGTVLLRYAIGDLTAISNEVCPDCGRQGPRIVTNTVRTFELVMFNGVLLNADGIKEAVTTIEGIEEYQIVFSKERESDPSSPDVLLVRVTARPDEREQVRTEVAEKVTAVTSIRPSIEFVDSRNDIFDPNQKFKSSRVVDLRPKEK
jgi:phenylacetate-CoA ligase